LSASWAAVILALSAIVVSPFVALLEQTDDHEARDGRTHIGHAALLHHDPRLDRHTVDRRSAAMPAILASEAVGAGATVQEPRECHRSASLPSLWWLT
jgi:hypothetical protein